MSRKTTAQDAAHEATKPYHHGNLRSALIEAGRDVLESEGLEKLSLRGVARRAGVSQTAPYHHFKDKNALLAAIAEQGFDEFRAAMAREADAAGGEFASPTDRLNAYGIGYVDFAVRNKALFRLMFGGQIGQREKYPRLMETASASFELLNSAVEDVVASQRGNDTARKKLVLGSWSVVHGLATLILDGRLDPADYGCTTAKDLAQLALAER